MEFFKPDVSIIIVNYHTSTLKVDCVKSIFQHTSDISYEIIIVDNDSEKNLNEILETKIGFINNIKFIFSNKNLGFGLANNEGFKIATGRNIFFLNPDTLLLNNAIKILSDFLDNHSVVGACGGNLFNKEKQPAFSFLPFRPGPIWDLNELTNYYILKLFYRKNKTFNFNAKPIEVGYISGADLMVKREVLKVTGGFLKDYFMYFEETDLCERIEKKGWKIYNVPSANIVHLEGKSFNEKGPINENKIRFYETSKKIYYRLNINPVKRKFSSMIYEVFLKSRILLTKPGNKNQSYKLRLKIFKE